MPNLEHISLTSALQDPLRRDYEALRIDAKGHYYIYRYLAGEGIFLRATIPSGATPPVFRKLSDDDMVPAGGWAAV